MSNNCLLFTFQIGNVLGGFNSSNFLITRGHHIVRAPTFYSYIGMSDGRGCEAAGRAVGGGRGRRPS